MEKELIQDQDQTKEVVVDTKDDTVTATETTTDTTAEDNSTATDKELNNSEENTKDVSPDLFSEETAPTEEAPQEQATPEQYDLSAYNLNEDQVSTIQPVLDRFKEVGMTQEQMDVVFEEIIGEPRNFKAELTATLTPDEKRNYKPMFETLLTIDGNTPEEVQAVMSDVRSVQFLNRLINKLSRPAMVSGMTTPEAGTMAGKTLDALKSEFKDFAKKANVRPGDRAKFIGELISKASNKEEATEYFKKFK